MKKDILRELDLAAINLEGYGCPKFELLNILPIQDCGHHKHAGHCAMVETHAFWRWVEEYKYINRFIDSEQFYLKEKKTLYQDFLTKSTKSS